MGVFLLHGVSRGIIPGRRPILNGKQSSSDREYFPRICDLTLPHPCKCPLSREQIAPLRGRLYFGNEIVFLGNLFSVSHSQLEMKRCKNKMMQDG
jgi:hypothetical protein